MCGITGIYLFKEMKVKSEDLIKMNDKLVHRGPDNGNYEIFNNVGLSHRRLSIIDLSVEANQPMSSDNNRFTIVFNGEIYNYQEIRNDLLKKDVIFKTNSDTEVVLKAFIEFGTEVFSKLNGMFALAIFDNEKNEVTITRDQFGIKPLYFFKDDEKFIFASEMKSIIAYPEIHLSLNKNALVEYVWFGNPLGKNTIYNEIEELSAGSFMKISNEHVELQQYFDINSITEKNITENEAVETIKDLFDKSIQRHLISDVPVGIFLSGGIDSSAITAYASKHYQGTLNTYSVGFDFAKGPNELTLAAEVASKFGTNHHEIHISGKNLIDTIESLVDSHDEPFGDAADIPLFLLTKELKNDVKVVLQGDGGDEFFGGYSRYTTIQEIEKWKKYSSLTGLIEILGLKNQKILRFQRFVNAITQKSPATRNALLLTMESKFTNPLRIFNKKVKEELNVIDPFIRYNEVYETFPKDFDKTQALFYTDSQIILKDTFFEKVDKSTMANSIEVRVPFIDKDLTEFMLSVPAELKVKNGISKYLLKKSLEGTVPDKILYGKKTGFSVPYSYWLKNDLEEYFLSQISTSHAMEILDRDELIKMFNIHKSNKGNYGYILWKTLILAIWINKQDKINRI